MFAASVSLHVSKYPVFLFRVCEFKAETVSCYTIVVGAGGGGGVCLVEAIFSGMRN